jgi:predicted polyphosphate/ATP-dependent NAD kinase
VIVNPIAGMGGRVGLKGTDGAETLARAPALGATPMAATRGAEALALLTPQAARLTVIAPPGAHGADAVAAAGLAPQALAGMPDLAGDRADTVAAATAMLRAGVELILFAGGDGTARDLVGVIGTQLPLLGVPTGVKMHSAVFGLSPRAAGRCAAAFLGPDGAAMRLREAEVMDIDEAALRQGRVNARLHGLAHVPEARCQMQASKAGARPDDAAALDALSRVIVREWPEDRLMILGCGTTARRVRRAIGFEGTLLGVDVALGGRPIALDVTEAQLLRLLDRTDNAGIIASVTGGQGFLFGRGNQQISAEVIRRVGRDRIMVVTGAAKLATLDPPALHVDTGSAEVDAMLAGYIHIHTAPGQRMVMRVAAGTG